MRGQADLTRPDVFIARLSGSNDFATYALYAVGYI